MTTNPELPKITNPEPVKSEPTRPTKVRIVWRGVVDGMFEMNWGGHRFETHVPQEVLTKEESHRLFAKRVYQDGYMIEESLPETAPNGQRILVTKPRWLSLHEMALEHPYFDVEGEEPKPRPQKFAANRPTPDAAREAATGEPWIGPNI